MNRENHIHKKEEFRNLGSKQDVKKLTKAFDELLLFMYPNK